MKTSKFYDGTSREGGQTACLPSLFGLQWAGQGLTMERKQLTDREIAELKRREAEIIARLERLKRTMSDTKALDTLAFKSKLYKEAQDELRHVQDKLAGLSED
jgi:hypothetical protein